MNLKRNGNLHTDVKYNYPKKYVLSKSLKRTSRKPHQNTNLYEVNEGRDVGRLKLRLLQHVKLKKKNQLFW